MNIIKCIFCNSQNIKNKKFIYYLNYLSINYYYYKCNKCKIVSVNPIPDNKVLKKIYGNEYYESFYLKENLNEKDFDYFFKKISKYLKSNFKILDYGCGDGHFLKLFSKKKYNIWGSDLDSNMLKQLQIENLNILPFDELNIHKNTFNFIYLRDVFEHSTNPRILINQIKNLLLDDGYLVIDGPIERNFSLTNYFISMNIKLKKILKKQNSETPPYHISLYSNNQIINFIKSFGNIEIIDYEIYETGWPLKNTTQLKNLIAIISLFVSKFFFFKKIYGNRSTLIFKKK